MEQHVQQYLEHLKGKKAIFCGIGRSHIPVMELFCRYGASVAACDRRTKETLGPVAQKLESMGVTLHLGEEYLSDLRGDLLFRTPGMKFYLPELTLARQQGVAVTSEMEEFFALCPCKIYAVTGSDGKTTTTTILSELLKASGRRVHLGGNIGKPLLPDIASIRKDDAAVVELSSFQLISMRKSPHVAVVTNLSPNHLDVHKDMQEYVDAKKNILLHQAACSKTVLNLENDITRSFAPLVRGQRFWFSSAQECDWGAWVREGRIVMQQGETQTELFPVSDIKLPGKHNVENFLAAITAVWGDVDVPQIHQVAQTFAGVPHRAELVRVHNGVSYYNDSIGTSPTRTATGTLQLYDQKIILIAGGYDKKLPFDGLADVIVEKVKTLILMGATADKIEAAVRHAGAYREGSPVILRADDMPQAVTLAARHAQHGDIVSLSPACASFDLYQSFEARGDHFKTLVNAL